MIMVKHDCLLSGTKRFEKRTGMPAKPGSFLFYYCFIICFSDRPLNGSNACLKNSYSSVF